MIFPCKYRSPSGEQSWASQIEMIDYALESFECRIRGRGSSYHVIIGRYLNGGFICIPSLGVCCDLADYSDTLWNAEQLEKHLSPVDAVTVANGVNTLKNIRDALGWYSPFPD